MHVPKWASLFCSAALVLVWAASTHVRITYTTDAFRILVGRSGLIIITFEGSAHDRSWFVDQVAGRGWSADRVSLEHRPDSLSSLRLELGLRLPVRTLDGPYMFGSAKITQRGLYIPLWIPWISMSAVTGFLFWIARRRRATAGCCVECGYDLTGNISGVCPECGVRRED
jgi:hypothetical protein